MLPDPDLAPYSCVAAVPATSVAVAASWLDVAVARQDSFVALPAVGAAAALSVAA